MEEERKVDESWKESAQKEKDAVRQEKPADEFNAPEADFKFFVTTLAIQASISLGIMANPGTNQKEENLPQAKFLIDTLAVIKDKTKGNLTKEEDELLEGILYELRMQYVAKTKPGGTQ